MKTYKTAYDLSDSFASDQVSFNENAGNRNISDVLSQITDDGPANKSSNSCVQQNAKVSLHSVNTNDVIDNNSKGSPTQNTGGYSKASAEYAAHQASALDEQQELEEDLALSQHFLHASTTGNRSYTLIAIIVFVCAGVIAYTLHEQMNSRIISLENQLLSTGNHQGAENNSAALKQTENKLSKEITIDSLFVSETKGSADGQTNTSVVETNAEVKTTLTQPQVLALKAEVKHLQEQLSIANNRIDELDIKPVTKPIRDMNDNVIQYEKNSEITSIPTSQRSQKVTARKRVSNTVGVNKPDVINVGNWKVNLASFSDKRKADTIFNQLKKKSLHPSLEIATVNGKKRYRLIVNGFDKRKDAERFVKTANKEFALSGAWIRKV